MKHLEIFVIHDGIENSVFPGQVLQPLREKLFKNPDLQILLITFERGKPSLEFLKCISGLRIKLFKKYIFLGRLSLHPAVWQLKNVLKKYKNFTITARGPMAGWICLKALGKKTENVLTVQARGLLAEEYKFVHPKTKNFLNNLIHTIRAYQYKSIEKKVYGSKNIQIEAVSHALCNFLQKKFDTQKNQITIACNDIPQKFQPAQIASWKKQTRKNLNICLEIEVYCFNGSIKPWQCPELVIDFFKTKLQKKSNIFLLVLTQNKQEFQKLLLASEIPEKKFLVLTVSHKKIYTYLAACDVGLIFRKQHIVNWVSRPTKVLEYQTVGLEIVHNRTVEWVTNTPLQTHKITGLDFPNDF